MAIERPTASTVAIPRPVVASGEPFAAQAPAVDTTKLDDAGRKLQANIAENRAQLVEHHATAVADQRPEIATQIAGLVSKLDQAQALLANKPKENVGAAKEKTQAVINEFNQVADAWAKPASAQTSAQTPAQTVAQPRVQTDALDSRAQMQATATTGADARLTALESRLTELETQNAQMRGQIEAKEKAEADEAKKPGFFRALLEVFEFLGRWFTPFFNIVSAIFRCLKIGYQLLTGKKVDWVNEGIRLAGDVAGIFCPPLGAVVNTGMNLWKNESQVLGGMNEIFDKSKKDNPFRSGFDGAVDWIKDTFNKAKATITGESPEPSKGSVDYRPVAAELST